MASRRAPFFQQFCRALFANTVHARDIVRLVPDHRLQIDQLAGWQTVSLLHLRRVVDDSVREFTPRCQHPDLVFDHLQEVAIAGDDDGLHALLAAA